MRNITLSPHGQQQLHAHLDCAVPGVCMAEFYPRQFDENIEKCFLEPVRFDPSDGTISPPDTPGAGMDLDREFLKQFRVG